MATSTACDNMPLVRKCLKQSRGEIDAAIELVIETLSAEECGSVKESKSVPEKGASIDADSTAAEPVPPTNVANGGECASASAVTSGQGQATDAVCDRCTADATSTATESDQDGCNHPPQQQSTNNGASEVATLRHDCVQCSYSMPGLVARSEADSCPPGRPPDTGSSSCEELGGKQLPDNFGNCSTVEPSESSTSNAVDAAPVKTGQPAKPKPGKRGGVRLAAANKRPANNKPCPCGSSKKYKNCCGVAAAASERRRKAAGMDDSCSNTMQAQASQSDAAVALATLYI